MSPFLFSASFCFLWLFSQKISLQDAPGTTILFSVDLRDPGFSDPLAWLGAPPCVARRAELFIGRDSITGVGTLRTDLFVATLNEEK